MTNQRNTALAAFDPLLPGRYLGPGLRVIRALGEGGQGLVVLAEDENLARSVAVKFLASPPDAAEANDFGARLRVEARAMARVRHPSVVQVFDVGQSRESPYLVMEYVPGETLEERLQACGGAMSPGEALGLLEQVALGLQAVHAANLAHGDLQPTNVLIGPDHCARVADFGLAFLSGGTAHYMAPELQAPGPHGLQVRQRADLYSLGVLAHELLVGTRPFDAPDRARVLAQHRHKAPPSLSVIGPGLPPELVHAVDACLAKDPAERPRSAGAVAEFLADTRRRMHRPSSRRVLVVDDDPGFRALVRAHVEATFEEVRLVEASGGEEALETFRRQPFDVVMLDLNMPEVNGVELAAALRGEESPPRILVLTGRGSAQDWALLRTFGVVALLAKPLEPEVFHAELRRALYA